MSGPPDELVRRVPLSRLSRDSLCQHIAANEAEREALARRFDLISLDRLEADVTLTRERGGTILLSADFAADFAQPCTVTLDPVPGTLSEYFELRYGPPEAEAGVPNGDDDPAFESLEEDAIDIGEAVAQEFSLCLPQFPRAPGAVIEEEAAEPGEDGPFAALAKLRGGEPQ